MYMIIQVNTSIWLCASMKKITKDLLQVRCKCSKINWTKTRGKNNIACRLDRLAWETPQYNLNWKSVVFRSGTNMRHFRDWRNKTIFWEAMRCHLAEQISLDAAVGEDFKFLSQMWQLYFLFLCNILYTTVPSSLSLKQAWDQYNVYTDFLLSSWERCRTTVEEMSPGSDAV